MHTLNWTYSTIAEIAIGANTRRRSRAIWTNTRRRSRAIWAYTRRRSRAIWAYTSLGAIRANTKLWTFWPYTFALAVKRVFFLAFWVESQAGFFIFPEASAVIFFLSSFVLM